MKSVDFTLGDFLIANLIVVTIVVVSYLFIRRQPRPPVQLNLKKPDASSVPPVPSVSRMPFGANKEKGVIHNPSRVEYRPRHRPDIHIPGRVEAPPPRDFNSSATDPSYQLGEEKDLNVLFQWNGHTWDAYEVLGLPAGSSDAAVRSAYEHLMRTVQPESRRFITAALEAITKRCG